MKIYVLVSAHEIIRLNITEETEFIGFSTSLPIETEYTDNTPWGKSILHYIPDGAALAFKNNTFLIKLHTELIEVYGLPSNLPIFENLDPIMEVLYMYMLDVYFGGDLVSLAAYLKKGHLIQLNQFIFELAYVECSIWNLEYRHIKPTTMIGQTRRLDLRLEGSTGQYRINFEKLYGDPWIRLKGSWRDCLPAIQ